MCVLRENSNSETLFYKDCSLERERESVSEIFWLFLRFYNPLLFLRFYNPLLFLRFYNPLFLMLQTKGGETAGGRGGGGRGGYTVEEVLSPWMQRVLVKMCPFLAPPPPPHPTPPPAAPPPHPRASILGTSFIFITRATERCLLLFGGCSPPGVVSLCWPVSGE